MAAVYQPIECSLEKKNIDCGLYRVITSSRKAENEEQTHFRYLYLK